MGHCGDFVQYLGHDMSIMILLHLDDPSDLVCFCSVSKSWRQFVITNDLCKRLCLKMLPELSCISHAIEVDNLIEPVNIAGCWQREYPLRNHKVYAFLSRSISPLVRTDCILEAIAASSTDNYPEEDIDNTLEPRDVVGNRFSYWCGAGESNPAAPETLVYKLMSNMCLVTEIHVQPLQAYFQPGTPIYPSRAVRFRMGHLMFPSGMYDAYPDKSSGGHIWAADNVMLTYTSPEFPMAKENFLQKFKLPEPVLCIGGFLLVELLGRVQTQAMDGLYYIGISHVQVVGRSLAPQFDVEILDSSGKCALKYYPETPQLATIAPDEDPPPRKRRRTGELTTGQGSVPKSTAAADDSELETEQRALMQLVKEHFQPRPPQDPAADDSVYARLTSLEVKINRTFRIQEAHNANFAVCLQELETEQRALMQLVKEHFQPRPPQDPAADDSVYARLTSLEVKINRTFRIQEAHNANFAVCLQELETEQRALMQLVKEHFQPRPPQDPPV